MADAASLSWDQVRADAVTTTDARGRRMLMRTWAMRGTLHILPPDLGAAVLALTADART